MAKKKEEVTEKVTTPTIDKIVEKTKPKNNWEVKDRMYYLNANSSPLTYTLRTGVLDYFDEEKGYEREIVYAPNQNTPFVDEMKGVIRKEHIVFRDGSLYVPKNKVMLQKFLSLYHPERNKTYFEVNKQQEASDEFDYIELELEAMNLASGMSIEEAEAVIRVEAGSTVDKMSSKEIRRDLLVMARRNPALFLNIAQDDNIHLRNMGIKAVERDILALSDDQRYFSWTSTGRKLMTVPFDEHPYTALAHWFKTDEGMEIYKQLEKRLG
tara:strand:+ start:30 stop:833 length:804 start_codon:yes stop_codon:yes gene_type:complete